MLVANQVKSTVTTLLWVGLGAALATGVLALPGRTVEAQSQAPREPRFIGPAVNPNITHSTYAPVDGKGGQEVSGPYAVVKGWPQPVTEGWTINAEGLYVESPDRIIAVGRGTRKFPWTAFWGPAAFRSLGQPIAPEEQERGSTIVVYDGNGKVIESWNQWRSILPDVQQVQANPHDPERHIWIATGQGLVQLSRDGQRHVSTLDAADVPQADPQNPYFVVEHFAWSSNGDLYAAGGYQVTRFSRDGNYLSRFGSPGNGPGEFGVFREGRAGAGIHGVVIDSNRNRLYVADRVNSRIQVFDRDGNYLDQWPNITAPYCIRLTQDGQYLWVGDGYTQKFAKYDALTGRLVPGSTWGTMGIAPGAFWGIHYFSTDSDGSLYVGEDLAFRIQKFVPRPGGNPEQLIGPLMQ